MLLWKYNFLWDRCATCRNKSRDLQLRSMPHNIQLTMSFGPKSNRKQVACRRLHVLVLRSFRIRNKAHIEAKNFQGIECDMMSSCKMQVIIRIYKSSHSSWSAGGAQPGTPIHLEGRIAAESYPKEFKQWKKILPALAVKSSAATFDGTALVTEEGPITVDEAVPDGAAIS